jgi:hypothetical protein
MMSAEAPADSAAFAGAVCACIAVTRPPPGYQHDTCQEKDRLSDQALGLKLFVSGCAARVPAHRNGACASAGAPFRGIIPAKSEALRFLRYFSCWRQADAEYAVHAAQGCA